MRTRIRTRILFRGTSGLLVAGSIAVSLSSLVGLLSPATAAPAVKAAADAKSKPAGSSPAAAAGKSPAGTGSAGKAGDELRLALELYNQKKFNEAGEYFQRYLKGRTPDSRTTYYLALCNMQTGQSARARQLFEYIVKNFPQSVEFSLSQKALTRWGGGKVADSAGGTAADTIAAVGDGPGEPLGEHKGKRTVLSDEEYKKEYAAIPKQATLRATGTSGGSYLMPGYINGQTVYFRPTKDWETRMSLQDLKSLRLEPPAGEAEFDEEDTKKEEPLWKVAYSVTLGGVTRKIPVTVMKEHKGYPQLGHAFFDDLKIEHTHEGLVLRKKAETLAKGKKESIGDYKAEYAKLPETTEFHYADGPNGHMEVDAYINGKRMKCWFDTGASAYFGANQLRELGITPPTGNPDSYTSGWAGKPVPVWKINASVRIGNMTRTLPLTVAEEWDKPPLLGQDFLRDYKYAIDAGGHRMTLTKKNSRAAAEVATNSLYDIPCRVEHEREFVTLYVNGRACDDVLIDTGASSTILSQSAAAGLGVEIPANAPGMMAGGVGGMIPFRQVNVSLKLGPVIKHDFPVMIGGNAGCAIGQDFMSGWRFTVDREAKLLRFFH